MWIAWLLKEYLHLHMEYTKLSWEWNLPFGMAINTTDLAAKYTNWYNLCTQSTRQWEPAYHTARVVGLLRSHNHTLYKHLITGVNTGATHGDHLTLLYCSTLNYASKYGDTHGDHLTLLYCSTLNYVSQVQRPIGTISHCCTISTLNYMSKYGDHNSKLFI